MTIFLLSGCATINNPIRIVISNPQDGQHFTNPTITVSGNITNYSGQTVTLYLNNIGRTIPVNNDGSFSYQLVLESGSNTIKVSCGSVTSSTITVYYDTGDTNELWVELTWDKDMSDVDLYVYEPDGTVVWYENLQGHGQLDRDDTDGYGPEHYTLTVNNAIHGTYRIRVHYYDTNGQTEPVNCHVVGKKLGSTVINKEFTLSQSDFTNDSPSANGPDWYDVGTISVP